MTDKIKEALELAKAILDYCPGDAWERECTAADRQRFDELYNELFPAKPPKPPEHTSDYYCSVCQKAFEEFLMGLYERGVEVG
jgi:hypothetical protein